MKPEFKIKAKKAPALTRELKRGCQGEDVKLLQYRLLDIGFYLGGYGADGYFGGRTRDAVDDFLCANGIKPDGRVTQDIWALFFSEINFAQFHNGLLKCLCRENGHWYCDGYYYGGINPGLKILLARIQEKMRDRTGIKNLCIAVKSNKTAYKGNGGYRCSRWNRRRGGATYSQHIYAKGADGFPCIDDKPAPVYFDLLFECAKECNPFGGIGTGTHDDTHDGVCHVDIRGVKSRWEYAR